MFCAKDLLHLTSGLPTAKLEHAHGPQDFEADNLGTPERASASSVIFASNEKQLQQALTFEPAAMIVDAKLDLPASIPARIAVFKTASVSMAMAAILPHFDKKLSRFEQSPPIHPTAVIHPEAKIGRDVIIGPGVVIGADTIIEDHVIIGANSVIERGARIGARTILHPLVFVGADCRLGTDCEIHPHTTIGSDGFGFAQDRERKHKKLPQLGRVVIGDRVEVGANCAIDRAAFHETKIGSGTKIDNLCHIAHNCEVGEDSALAAGFFMAGSSKLGKRFMVGGTSALGDHVQIADDVTLAGRTVVVNDLRNSGAYGGYPVQPLKDYLKTLSSLPHLVRLRKDVSRIMKHLGLE